MSEPPVIKPPPHLLYIQPVQDPEQVSGLEMPSEARRAYVNLGWIKHTPDVLEEDLNVGDLVCFMPWTEKNVPTKAYHSFRTHHYVVHEDDCLLVIEDW